MAVVLLSTAYIPPIEYFYRISRAGEVLIEKQENFLKQTYRNRCYISSAGGIIPLTVPVYLGSFHKTPVRDIRIDYSKRWQQVHIRAIRSSYASAPFFMFYCEQLEKVILYNHKFLLDLNMELLNALLQIMKVDVPVSYTSEYLHPGEAENDFRYILSPKKRSLYEPKSYIQVFPSQGTQASHLSIIDLIFNTGPGATDFL